MGAGSPFISRNQVRVFDQKSQRWTMLKGKKGIPVRPAVVSPKCLVPPFLVRLPRKQRGAHLPTRCSAAFQILTVLLSQPPLHVLGMCSKWLIGSIWNHSPENPETMSAVPSQPQGCALLVGENIGMAFPRATWQPPQPELWNRSSSQPKETIQNV